MIRLSRMTFLVGAVTFIVIGVLHSFVHLTELAGPDLEARFDAVGPVALQGDSVRAWDLFQGLSLLMGAFSVTLGVVLIGILRETDPLSPPPALVSLAVCVQLIVIAAVGGLYLSAFQIVGGVVGIALFAMPFIVALRRA
ncbi:MAG: hypothetical protein MK180_05200 [Rhodobacteraceae bacterium]|nr:hypothetical protein [Paracoccaceae bacterium]